MPGTFCEVDAVNFQERRLGFEHVAGVVVHLGCGLLEHGQALLLLSLKRLETLEDVLELSLMLDDLPTKFGEAVDLLAGLHRAEPGHLADLHFGESRSETLANGLHRGDQRLGVISRQNGVDGGGHLAHLQVLQFLTLDLGEVPGEVLLTRVLSVDQRSGDDLADGAGVEVGLLAEVLGGPTLDSIGDQVTAVREVHSDLAVDAEKVVVVLDALGNIVDGSCELTRAPVGESVGHGNPLVEVGEAARGRRCVTLWRDL